MDTSRPRPSVRRLPLLCAAGCGTVLLLAAPAAAHVSVEPARAERGGYSTIAFKVPNERDKASTVKVEVTLPVDHPLASMPNVVLTPHIGGATYDTEANHTKLIADGLAALVAGEVPDNCVNPEVLRRG